MPGVLAAIAFLPITLTMMDDLTLEMNRARQSEITQEILEVVAGAEALG